MLQHQAKCQCQLIPMPLCEWDKKARWTHTIAPYRSFHRGYAEHRMVSPSAGLSYSHFVSTSPPICHSVCKKRGQYLPHPCLCSVGQLVVSVVRQSFHIPAFQLHHPGATAGLIPANVYFYFLFFIRHRQTPIHPTPQSQQLEEWRDAGPPAVQTKLFGERPRPSATAGRMIECLPLWLKHPVWYSFSPAMWITPTHCGNFHLCSKSVIKSYILAVH